MAGTLVNEELGRILKEEFVA